MIYTIRGNLPYYIFMFSFLFGCCLYDYIQHNYGWSYTDELIVFVLFMLLCQRKQYLNREFICCICIFIFFLIYSLSTHINSTVAIFSDFVIQIKPFLAFYSVYLLGFNFSLSQKYRIKNVCIIIAIILVPIGLGGISTQANLVGHWSRYATLTTITAFLYLYSTSRSKRDIIISVVIMSLGVLSGTGKSLGFVAITVCIFLFAKKDFVKFSLKNILIATIGLLTVVYVAWDDIQFYLVQGNSGDIETTFARALMYNYTPILLDDYFPFGTGLGTYATSASCEYWSPIYRMYKLDLNYEIGKRVFVTDAFYPSLAEFGYFGVACFLFFWGYYIKKAYQLFKLNRDSFLLKCIILIVVFFAIEGVADSTFTQNRGMFMMMLLAIFIKESELKSFKINNRNA